MLAQCLVLETTDVKLAPCEHLKQSLVLCAVEVEALVAPVINGDCLGYSLQVLYAGAWVIKSGDELQIPPVCRLEYLSERIQAVNVLLHASVLPARGTITMVDFPEVAEVTDIVDGGFDTQDDAELIVHLYSDRTHVVLYSRPENAGVKLVAHFALVIPMEFLPQESGDILRFNRVDRCTYQRVVQSLEVGLPSEDDVGCIFSLHDAPVILKAKLLDDRAVTLGENVESLVQVLNPDTIREPLGLFKVANLKKGVVFQHVGDAFLLKLGCQPIVPVEVELQSERSPGGDPQVAETELLVDEVEIVMKTFAGIVLEKGFMRFLVMPRLVTGTGFHGGEDVYQAGMMAALFEDLVDSILLAECLDLTNELDLDAILFGYSFGVLADFISQFLGELGVIKDADVLGIAEPGHSAIITPSWECSLDNDTIIAAYNTANLCFVLVCDSPEHSASPRWYWIHSPYSAPYHGSL